MCRLSFFCIHRRRACFNRQSRAVSDSHTSAYSDTYTGSRSDSCSWRYDDLQH